MFNLFAKRELIITEVEGIRFVFNTKGTKQNLKKFEFLKQCMNEVPTIVKEKLAKRNLLIRFTDEEDVVGVTGDKNVLGFYCDAGMEVIFIKCNQSYFNLKSTLFHEIGHFVDKYIGRFCECDYISLIDEDFHEVAIKEQKIYNFDYYKNNIKEYFAQSFSELLLNSNIIKLAPQTKSAMETYVESLYAC